MAKKKTQPEEDLHETILALAYNGSKARAIAVKAEVPLKAIEFFMPLLKELAQLKKNPDKDIVRNKIVMNAVGWIMSNDPAIQLRGQNHLMKLWPQQYANIFKELLHTVDKQRVLVEAKVVDVVPEGDQAKVLEEIKAAEAQTE